LYVDISGITIARKIDKMGMRSSDTAQIFFEDVRVPQTHIIGDEGMGFTYQMLQFQEERIWATAAGRFDL
jgi:citronellyl-CoA dehydrogenase